MTENAPDAAVRWVLALQARGVTLRVRNGRLWLQPASAYRELSDEELLTLRRCRAEIKALVECGRYAALPAPVPAAPTPAPAAPPEEPEPELYLPYGGRRIVEQDVIEALTSLGDQALADYRAGRTSKAEGFAIAHRRLRQLQEL